MTPALALATACLIGSAPALADPQSEAGDVLRWALPLGTLTAELARGEGQGARQFAAAYVATVGATEILKRTVRAERPDRSNERSFPSGHAAPAFSAATYVHRRYGADAAWPLYAAAVYVGYTRVAAERHRWIDVAGSAALAATMSWWLVERRSANRLPVVTAMPERPRVDLQFQLRW
ncbi:phosphatase PAP2 family protein [Piscinibacter sp.]|jgi:membrane-associated phospholipid phosphatase|uniref:phosphatase PAP2 family protein n=1 Tax=Piscinibacter sp. TaxID=1903157 RepID=UPI002F3E3DCA